MSLKFASTTLLLLLAAASPTEAAPQYHITDLGVLPGAAESYATAINDSGQVVGWCVGGSFGTSPEAFLWTREGGMIDLGQLPGGVTSYATGINNQGQVVGGSAWNFYQDGSSTPIGTVNAFLWDSGNGMQLLPGVGGGPSDATGINDNGQVIGQIGNTVGLNRGAVWDGAGGFQTLPPRPPGGFDDESLAIEINNNGLVLGLAVPLPGDPVNGYQRYVVWNSAGDALYDLGAYSSHTMALNNNNQAAVVSALNGHVQLWSPTGGFQDVGSPLPFSAIPAGINDQADIVGGRFLWTVADGWRDLNSLTDTSASTYLNSGGVMDINNAGQIVGSGGDGAGQIHAFLLTPEAGSSQSNPILPDSVGGAPFLFNNVSSDKWFDPPLVSSFTYTTQPGTLFSQILDFPTGFSSPFTVAAEGSTLGQFGPGQSVSFAGFAGGGVSEFTVSGIHPLVDSEDPQGFPLQIGFTTPTGSFVMTAVPEPATHLLLLFAVAGWCLRRGRAG